VMLSAFLWAYWPCVYARSECWWVPSGCPQKAVFRALLSISLWTRMTGYVTPRFYEGEPRKEAGQQQSVVPVLTHRTCR